MSVNVAALRARQFWVRKDGAEYVPVTDVERDALLAVVDAARVMLAEWDNDLHERGEDDRCEDCDDPWPCPTARWVDALAALSFEETP